MLVLYTMITLLETMLYKLYDTAKSNFNYFTTLLLTLLNYHGTDNDIINVIYNTANNSIIRLLHTTLLITTLLLYTTQLITMLLLNTTQLITMLLFCI